METSKRHNALIIATEGPTTNLLFEEVFKHWKIEQVIYESKRRPIDVIKSRMRKIGFFQTLGQLWFILFATPFLKNKTRVASIIKANGYASSRIAEEEVSRIASVNDQKLIELIQESNPSIIFINGTRIISKSILEQISVPVVNIHVGITPQYRGVHGGYWALKEKNPNLFGVTLHLVDAGIDTGQVIDQKVIEVSPKDNYGSYPFLQFCGGLELIAQQAENLKSGSIQTKSAMVSESKLHYHPRLFQYMYHRLFKGVK